MRNTGGKYAVPDEVKACKPKDVDCIVKKIAGHYYVYERKVVDDPKRPGRTKKVSGSCIGKIEGGRYIPKEGIPTPDVSPAIKEYGGYAVLMAQTRWLREALVTSLGPRWGIATYALALCQVAEGGVLPSMFEDAFADSVLSEAWPEVPVGRHDVEDLLSWLGGHQAECAAFERVVADEGSGSYAFVWRALPGYPDTAGLAAYGVFYDVAQGSTPGIVEVWDVGLGRPVAVVRLDDASCDGSLIREVLAWPVFEGARFFVDDDVYAEEILDLLHSEGRTFVVACPRDAWVKRAAKRDLAFTGEFARVRRENGIEHAVRIRFLERDVRGLVDAGQAETGESGAYADAGMGDSYGDDRVVVYRDEALHDRLVTAYRERIGWFTDCTEEGLAEISSTFGSIALRTNMVVDAQDLYASYLGSMDVCVVGNRLTGGMGDTQDRTVWRGTVFVRFVASLVEAELARALRQAQSETVSKLSVPDCLAKARRLKACRQPDGSWRVSVRGDELAAMMAALGVDVAEDVKRLQDATFGE